MHRFRHGGIYKLPNQNTYTVYNFGGGRYLLYPSETGPSVPPDYELTETGELRHWPGMHETAWTAADLEDTGRTYNFPQDHSCP